MEKLLMEKSFGAIDFNADFWVEAYDITPQCVLFCSHNQIIYANQAAVALFCCNSKNDLLGKSIFEFIPLGYEEVLNEFFEIIYKRKGFQATTRLKMRCKYYNEFEVELSADLIHSYKTPTFALFLNKTKSNSKNTIYENESIFTQVKKQFKDFFMQIPVPMVLLEGEDFNFKLANPLYEKLIGKKFIEGQSFKKVFAHNKEVSRLLSLLDKVYKTGEPYFGNELHFHVKENMGTQSDKWVNISYHPTRNEQGEVKGILVIVQDVTEQVQARKISEEGEKKYRTFTDQIPQLIWTCLPDGSCNYLNQQWLKYTGFPESEQLGDQWLEKVIHPEDQARVNQYWMDAVRGKHSYDIEYRIKRYDGVYRWFHSKATAVLNKKGQIDFWLGTCTDIEERKVIESKLLLERNELEENKKKLEATIHFLKLEYKIRDRFVAALSHDLRTPLAAAKINTELLEKSVDETSKNFKYIQRISGSIERMDQMISDLLDVNLVRMGEKLPIKIEQFCLNELIKETLDELSVIHGNRFVLIANLEILGFWSKSGIRRIIENLCNNAVKYGLFNSPIKTILLKEEQSVRITVHNEGAPIDSNYLASVFEPFKRLENLNSNVNGNKGWGIGLALVKSLAEAHGGSVRVESTIENGTNFVVVLPLDASEYNC